MINKYYLPTYVQYVPHPATCRWLGESYCVYLRDTNKISQQHNEALNESSQAVMDLIESDINNTMEPLSDKDARESGEYHDVD